MMSEFRMNCERFQIRGLDFRFVFRWWTMTFPRIVREMLFRQAIGMQHACSVLLEWDRCA